MFISQPALVQMALAHNVFLAQLLVSLIFFPGCFQGDGRLCQDIARTDFFRGNEGDTAPFSNGGTFVQVTETDNPVGLGDDGHFIAGG